MLKDCARENSGVVGGSFLCEKGGGRYNTFVLAFSDGSFLWHDKDQPTMWENCYYRGGGDDGVLETPVGNAGVALCWEFIRTRTVKRLLEKVDFVVGGSCWWTLPRKKLPLFPRSLSETNLALMKETPSRFARMLGVPVIHAAHAGAFSGKMPWLPGFPYLSSYLGETQIVDGTGTVLARMEAGEGQGFIMADVDISRRREPLENFPDRFWIPELPWQFRFAWNYQNFHGSRYYRRNFR